MTTPVFMSGGESNATMAFVLPAKLKNSSAPRPQDPALTLRELPPARFAVRRFSGGRSAAKEEAAWRSLRDWAATQGWKTNASPVFAYFDPPWTPGFLRRNEVMLRIETAP